MIFLYYFLLNKTFLASFSHGIMSIIFLLFSDNILFARLSLFNSLVYFIADLFFRYNMSKTIHHFISIFGCIMGLYLSPEITIFGAKLFGIIEVSNPFWTFLRLRIEKSDEIYLPSWYDRKTSGLIYIIAFVLIRIVWFNSFVYLYLPKEMPDTVYYVTFIPLQLLNVYWFSLLMKGALKEIRKK